MKRNKVLDHPTLKPNNAIKISSSWFAVGILSIATFICARAYVEFKRDEKIDVQKKLYKEFELRTSK